MKNRQFTSLFCSGVLSLSAASLLAQQNPQNPASPTTTAPQGSSLNQGAAGTSSAQGLSGTSATDLRSRALGQDASGANALTSGNDIRMSQILNNAVRAQDGRTVGFVRDLTVDPESGTIQFAILSLNLAGATTDPALSARETVPSNRSSNTAGTTSPAAASMTGKLVPVPWQLFGKGSSTSSSLPGQAAGTLSGLTPMALTLNIDDAKLRSAPSFDSSNWTEIQSGSLAQRSYSHFGVDQSALGSPASSISGQGTSGTLDRQTPRQEGIRPDSSATSPDRSGQPQNRPDGAGSTDGSTANPGTQPPR